MQLKFKGYSGGSERSLKRKSTGVACSRKMDRTKGVRRRTLKEVRQQYNTLCAEFAVWTSELPPSREIWSTGHCSTSCLCFVVRIQVLVPDKKLGIGCGRPLRYTVCCCNWKVTELCCETQSTLLPDLFSGSIPDISSNGPSKHYLQLMEYQIFGKL